MAAGTLPAPGTDLGPCPEPCPHIDCQASREQATSTCHLCLEPIGYERRFYASDAKLVHASCLEDDKS